MAKVKRSRALQIGFIYAPSAIHWISLDVDNDGDGDGDDDGNGARADEDDHA